MGVSWEQSKSYLYFTSPKSCNLSNFLSYLLSTKKEEEAADREMREWDMGTRIWKHALSAIKASTKSSHPFFEFPLDFSP